MAGHLGMHVDKLWRGRGDVTCGSLGQLGAGLVRGRSHTGGSRLLGLVGIEGRPTSLWPMLGLMAGLVRAIIGRNPNGLFSVQRAWALGLTKTSRIKTIKINNKNKNTRQY